jgi:rod shape-determining protein MreC
MQPLHQRTSSLTVFLNFVKSSSIRYVGFAFVLLSLLLIFLSQLVPTSLSSLRTAVTDSFAPFLEVISQPLAMAGDKLADVTDIRTLKAENIRLREENERLKAWYETALKLQAENQSLRAFLNFPKNPEIGYLTTRAIAFGGGAFVKSLLVPVGRRDGVKVGQAVLAGEGMVGRIIEVGENSARVLLLSDLQSRIPVLVQNTRQRAILVGGHDDHDLRLERLSISSATALEVGARIVTSGDGGWFPPDIPVGEIVSHDGGKIKVRPLVALDRLSYVQIIQVPTSALPDLQTGEGTRTRE